MHALDYSSIPCTVTRATTSAPNVARCPGFAFCPMAKNQSATFFLDRLIILTK